MTQTAFERQIEANLSKLSRIERQIIDWIQANGEKAVHMSVSQISNNCNAAESSIIRTCQALGFSGYRDFRIVLAIHIASKLELRTDHPDQLVISIEDDYATVVNNLFSSYQQALDETKSSFDYNQFSRAVNAINTCNSLSIFSSGTSAPIAEYVLHRFVGLGLHCTNWHDYVEQCRVASTLNSRDVVLVINHTGRFINLLNAAKIARDKGAVIISITNYLDSPIAKISDIPLITHGRRIKILSGNTHYLSATSKVAQIAIIDCLMVGISINRPEIVIPNVVSMRKSRDMFYYWGDISNIDAFASDSKDNSDPDGDL